MYGMSPNFGWEEGDLEIWVERKSKRVEVREGGEKAIFEVGSVFDGRGNGKGNGSEHGSIELRGTEHGGEIRDRELG